MSVIIKGMNMPRNCMFCPLYVRDSESKHCAVTDKWNAVSGINRLYDCPLKSIEELIEKMKENCNYDNKDKLSDYSIDLDEAIDIIKEYCEVK